MQITFDTTTITDDEVRGIFALLDTVRPAAFDPGPFSASELETSIAEKVSTFTSEDGNFRIDPNTCTVTVANGPIEIEVPTHDSTGLQWDERIHASSKALNADGTWRTKRGVDKALVESVEATLRTRAEVDEPDASDESDPAGRIEAALTVPTPPAPPAPPAPEAPTAPLALATTVEAPVAPSPISAPAAAISPFVALMKRVTTAQGAGKLTPVRVKELLESIDKKGIMDLRTDDDALASFAVLLDGEGV